MFGLTLEKLVLVVLVTGLVIGPKRLPEYATRLAEWVRAARAYVDGARAAAEREMGVAVTREEWEALDPRRYDPRKIVRDALDPRTAAPSRRTAASEVLDEPQAVDTAPASSAEEEPEPAYGPAVLEEAARVRPGQRYLVTGGSAHPRRTPIDSLPADDPRRLAAEQAVDQPVETPVDVPGVWASA